MTTLGTSLTVRYVKPDPSSSLPFYSLYSPWVLLFPKVELEYEETSPSMKGQHSQMIPYNGDHFVWKIGLINFILFWFQPHRLFIGCLLIMPLHGRTFVFMGEANKIGRRLINCLTYTPTETNTLSPRLFMLTLGVTSGTGNQGKASHPDSSPMQLTVDPAMT